MEPQVTTCNKYVLSPSGKNLKFELLYLHVARNIDIIQKDVIYATLKKSIYETVDDLIYIYWFWMQNRNDLDSHVKFSIREIVEKFIQNNRLFFIAMSYTKSKFCCPVSLFFFSNIGCVKTKSIWNCLKLSPKYNSNQHKSKFKIRVTFIKDVLCLKKWIFWGIESNYK